MRIESHITLLAASPAFGGPATRPYRICLCGYAAGGYSVHRVYEDELGGMSDGSYFPENEYRYAMWNWSDRSAREINNRATACWLHLPLPVKDEIPL